ncbi:MAG: hypothetical protein DMG32_18870 [Acidobacteria bacterium]|nr:MAG: hypothetical protein DMG32_18870 [Acidobacteriota bacterium]
MTGSDGRAATVTMRDRTAADRALERGFHGRAAARWAETIVQAIGLCPPTIHSWVAPLSLTERKEGLPIFL